MKRIVSIIISVLLIVSLVPVTAFADDTSQTVRYSVLILDSSGSMDGTPCDNQRIAAKKFCETILKADGTNKVAIVKINSSSSKVCDFTDDLAALETAVDNISAYGGTNMENALVIADNLLADISVPGAIKNIVLCSDGMPESGNTTDDGPYNYNDYYDYEYANYVYKTAHEIMDKKINIYTLGFFHNLDGDELEFGRRLMKDIQNKNYYDVTDPEKLVFTFGEIADDITGGHYPIIIVPGIMGSRLFNSSTKFDDSTRVWAPDSLSTVWNIGEKVKNDKTLYVRPCENQNIDTKKKDASTTVDDYGREYGAADSYKSIVDRLCSEYPYTDDSKYRPVYFFSYDWRKSNADSAEKLSEAIGRILSETGETKVDIVAHSMGGLVTSRYYRDHNGANQTNKIITCGTPYEGAPKLINCVMTDQVIGDSIKDLALSLCGLSKSIKASFRGVAELTPTENYFSKIAMQKDHWLPFGWGDYDLDYDSYKKICREIFGEDNFNSALRFQTSIHGVNSSYNILLSHPNSYFSIGINHKTISSIKFQFMSNGIDQTLYESDLNYSTLGDGTVPYLSASVTEQIEKLDSNRWRTFDADHGETINKSECMDWITDILDSGNSDVPSDELTLKGYTVVRIACPVDVTVTKGSETLSSDLTKASTDSTSFGRLDLIGENDEIKMLCLDTDDYNVTLNGTGSGFMDYEVRSYDAYGKEIKTTTFSDVSITDKTIIKTTANVNDASLNVDSDGDGKTDTTVYADSDETYTITAKAGSGGSISPSGAVSVKSGESQTFKITPDSGYEIDEVLVDDEEQGAIEKYTFKDVKSKHTISATFTKSEEDEIDISDCTISGLTSKTYTGKPIKQNLSVTYDGEDAEFKLSYKNNINAGIATVRITGTGNYTGSVTRNFRIKKAPQPMKVTVSNKALTLSQIRRLDGVIKNAVKVKGNKGALLFTKLKGTSSVLNVGRRNGYIKIAKGVRKGRYVIKLKVSAKGSKNYTGATKNVIVKIGVK